MNADEMFRSLTLESISITGLQAQLQQGVEARGVECHAHVEFQLTPNQVEGAQPMLFVLQTRLSCVGTPLRGSNRSKLFDLEIRASANYRQVGAGAIAVGDFATHHTVFARHLFAALSLRAQSLLQDLGMQNIRLPLDLPQELSAAQQGPVVLN